MSYVSRWEQLKKDFETSTGKARPKETTKKAIVGTVQKASGLTPILKDVDSALQKKTRAPLEQALNKLMVARSAYGTFLSNEQKQFQNDPEDPDLIVWQAYHKLIFGMQAIETDASKEAKALQEEKAPGKVAIEWLSLEGDVKGTIAAAKKDLTAFAALEKQYSVLKKADVSVKAAETYTKAAARTDHKAAKDALELFKKEAKKCSDDLTKIIGTEKKNANFTKAVEKFRDAMKALGVAARIDAQIRNLQTALVATA